MPSGGGHDAAAFAQAGVPAGMLFVRNQNGSHNPHEAMRMEDFAAGCAVMTRWAAEMAGNELSPERAAPVATSTTVTAEAETARRQHRLHSHGRA